MQCPTDAGNDVQPLQEEIDSKIMKIPAADMLQNCQNTSAEEKLSDFAAGRELALGRLPINSDASSKESSCNMMLHNCSNVKSNQIENDVRNLANFIVQKVVDKSVPKETISNVTDSPAMTVGIRRSSTQNRTVKTSQNFCHSSNKAPDSQMHHSCSSVENKQIEDDVMDLINSVVQKVAKLSTLEETNSNVTISSAISIGTNQSFTQNTLVEPSQSFCHILDQAADSKMLESKKLDFNSVIMEKEVQKAVLLPVAERLLDQADSDSMKHFNQFLLPVLQPKNNDTTVKSAKKAIKVSSKKTSELCNNSTKETLDKSSISSKMKIQPILGHATLSQMIKINGPFPIVYIGPPNKLDHQTRHFESKKIKDGMIDLTEDEVQFSSVKKPSEHLIQTEGNSMLHTDKVGAGKLTDCEASVKLSEDHDVAKQTGYHPSDESVSNQTSAKLEDNMSSTKMIDCQSSAKLSDKREIPNLIKNHNGSKLTEKSVGAQLTNQQNLLNSKLAIPSSNLVPPKVTLPTLSTIRDSYDIQKAMNGFLGSSSATGINTKPKTSNYLMNPLQPVPSLVISGPRACETPAPSIQNQFRYPVAMPTKPTPLTHLSQLHPTNFKTIVPSHVSPHRFPAYFSTAVTVPSSLPITKARFQASVNGAVKTLTTTHPYGGGSVPVLFSDLRPRKTFPIVNHSIETTQSSTFNNVLKRKWQAPPMLKVARPENMPPLKKKIAEVSISGQPVAQNRSIISFESVRIPAVLTSSKVGHASEPVYVKPDSDKSISAVQSRKVRRPPQSVFNAPESGKSTSAVQNKKRDHSPKSKAEKLTHIPVPPTMGRNGVLVKFEDNVQLWIDKLRDLTFLDDEPVMSWKLEVGTDVAARYSDGLFYDAVILATHGGSAVRGWKSTVRSPPVHKKPRKSNDEELIKVDRKSPSEPIIVDITGCDDNQVNPETRTTPPETVVKTPPKEIEKNKTPSPKNSKSGVGVTATKSSPSIGLPRVRIQKLDFRDGKKDTWNAKIIDNEVANEVDSSEKPREEEKATLQVKCPNCFLVFRSVTLFRQHQKTVCGCKGVTIASGKIVDPDVTVVVDDSGVPPIVTNFSRNGVPRDRDGKRCFRRGTHFLHRWQTNEGSKWYNGKILRILESKKKGTHCEFEVEYLDDDQDNGTMQICLYEDYPHDIRIITR